MSISKCNANESYLGKSGPTSTVPGRLNAILSGSDKEWELVHPCDVDHSSVVVNDTKMNSSTANT